MMFKIKQGGQAVR